MRMPARWNRADAASLRIQEAMSKAHSGTENSIDAAEQCRRDDLRAEYEGFEFRVPAEGRVLVTNVSYGEGEIDDHRNVVSVETGVVWSCTCPHHEHRSARCKHMRAVANTDAVIMAASALGDGLDEGRP